MVNSSRAKVITIQKDLKPIRKIYRDIQERRDARKFPKWGYKLMMFGGGRRHVLL